MFHDVFYAFPYASSSPFVVLKRIASGSSSSSPFAVTLLVSNAFVDEVGEKKILRNQAQVKVWTP